MSLLRCPDETAPEVGWLDPWPVRPAGGRRGGVGRAERGALGPPAFRRGGFRRPRRGAGRGPGIPRDRPAGLAPACPLPPLLSRRSGTPLEGHRPFSRGGTRLLRRLHGGRRPPGLALVPDDLSGGAGP